MPPQQPTLPEIMAPWGEERPQRRVELTFHVPEAEFDMSEFTPNARFDKMRGHVRVIEQGFYQIGNVALVGVDYDLELDGDFFENPHFVKMEMIT